MDLPNSMTFKTRKWVGSRKPYLLLNKLGLLHKSILENGTVHSLRTTKANLEVNYPNSEKAVGWRIYGKSSQPPHLSPWPGIIHERYDTIIDTRVNFSVWILLMSCGVESHKFWLWFLDLNLIHLKLLNHGSSL